MSKTQSEVMKSVENMQMKDSTQTKSPATQGEKVTQSKQVKFNFNSDIQNTLSTSTLESAHVEPQIDLKNSKQNW